MIWCCYSNNVFNVSGIEHWCRIYWFSFIASISLFNRILGIPCLTVYDSFIVPLQYRELLDSIKDNTPYVDRRGISKVLPK